MWKSRDVVCASAKAYLDRKGKANLLTDEAVLKQLYHTNYRTTLCTRSPKSYTSRRRQDRIAPTSYKSTLWCAILSFGKVRYLMSSAPWSFYPRISSTQGELQFVLHKSLFLSYYTTFHNMYRCARSRFAHLMAKRGLRQWMSPFLIAINVYLFLVRDGFIYFHFSSRMNDHAIPIFTALLSIPKRYAEQRSSSPFVCLLFLTLFYYYFILNSHVFVCTPLSNVCIHYHLSHPIGCLALLERQR